jgi:hypothetical protein
MCSSRGLEQRREVALDARLGAEPARPGVGVDDRELDLVLVGVEVEEELVDLVDDLGRSARRGGRPC